MSKQPERLLIITKQDELDYWKRKYHELLDYLEGKNMGEESKQETLEKEYHEWMRRPGGGVEVRRSDGTIIDAIGELERLIALLREAEAKHESAQKMCDHWEVKAADWKAKAEKAEAERDELKRQKGISNPIITTPIDWPRVPVDWQRVRIDAAIAAMQSLMPDLRELSYSTKWVVQRADALVAELQKKEVQG